jgi:hypothetical protein
MSIKMHTYGRLEWTEFTADVPMEADTSTIVNYLGFLSEPVFVIGGSHAGVSVYYPTHDNTDIDSYLVRLWSEMGEGHNRWITCTSLQDLVDLLDKLLPIVRPAGAGE